jgi:hypothetical protein
VKEGNESTWREISQALEDVGISEDMINEHRDFIVEWLSKALKEGHLEERQPQTIEAQSGDRPSGEPEYGELVECEPESTAGKMRLFTNAAFTRYYMPPAEIGASHQDMTLSGCLLQPVGNPMGVIAEDKTMNFTPTVSILFIDDKNTGMLKGFPFQVLVY